LAEKSGREKYTIGRMEEAPENSKESPHSAYANGMKRMNTELLIYSGFPIMISIPLDYYTHNYISYIYIMYSGICYNEYRGMNNIG
jgi:hypothetical protein